MIFFFINSINAFPSEGLNKITLHYTGCKGYKFHRFKSRRGRLKGPKYISTVAKSDWDFRISDLVKNTDETDI